MSVQTGGGGGYGIPLNRDPQVIALDVTREYVSREAARREYGVVLDRETFAVDVEATKVLRSQLRAESEVATAG